MCMEQIKTIHILNYILKNNHMEIYEIIYIIIDINYPLNLD